MTLQDLAHAVDMQLPDAGADDIDRGTCMQQMRFMSLRQWDADVQVQ